MHIFFPKVGQKSQHCNKLPIFGPASTHIYPRKIGTGISPGSRQDSRRSPGSRRDPAEVARFPGGILPGKNSRRVSRQESRREICTRRDPAKKKTLLQEPGENPAGKQNLDSIRGENLILAE